MTSTFTVRAIRLSTGVEIPYLAERFDSRESAERDAVAKNSKAYTPFFFLVREA